MYIFKHTYWIARVYQSDEEHFFCCTQKVIVPVFNLSVNKYFCFIFFTVKQRSTGTFLFAYGCPFDRKLIFETTFFFQFFNDKKNIINALEEMFTGKLISTTFSRSLYDIRTVYRQFFFITVEIRSGKMQPMCEKLIVWERWSRLYGLKKKKKLLQE